MKRIILFVSLVSFGHLFHDIFTALVTPLVPALKESLSLSYSQAGLIIFLLSFPSVLSAFISKGIEKHNPKWFMIFCPLITGLAVLSIGLTNNYYIILFLTLIAGLSAGAFHVPIPTLIKKVVPNRTGIALSGFQLGGEAARTLGPIVAIPIIGILGLKRMHYLIPLLVVVTLVYYFSFNSVNTQYHSKPREGAGLLVTLREGRVVFILLLFISLQKAFLTTIMKSYLPVYLRDLGNSYAVSSGSLAIVQIANVLGVILSGFLVDKLGAKKVLIAIVSGAFIFPVLMVLFPGLPFYPMIFLIGFISFASIPPIYSLIQNYSFSSPTTANGLFITFNFGISSIILLIGGLLSDYFSISYTYKVYSYLSLVGVGALFILLTLFKEKNENR